MIEHFIDNKLTIIGSVGTFNKIDPSTGELLVAVANAGQEIINVAVESSKKAFVSWKKLSIVQRGEYFDRLAQLIKRDTKEIANLISLETGKNLNESLAEVNESLHSIQYWHGLSRMPYGEIVASEIETKTTFVERQPRGLCLVLSSFNFPMAIGGCWSSAPAILSGNVVIWKSSELSPLVTDKVAKLYKEAGFPPGVLNVIYGGKDTGALLVKHKDINCILFTGSYNVGISIKIACAGEWNKSVYCEMGSKTAMIICNDFDVDQAVDLCIPSAFKLGGQRCVSTSRFIVHRDIINQFIDKFCDKASKLKIGNPLKERDVYYGSLINQNAIDKVNRFIELSRNDKDVKVLLHGKQIDRPGYFITPHVYLREWDKQQEHLTEECFAPFCAIIPFDNLEQAVNIHNDVDYGLAMSCLTNDFRKAKYIKDNCQYGIGYWNCASIGSESHVPFTAIKKSGNSSSAARTIEAVTYEASWTVNYDEKFKFAQGMV